MSIKPPSSLVTVNIPFGYSLASLLSLYLYEPKDLWLPDRLGFVTLVGSLITSFLIIYQPINRYALPFYSRRYFLRKYVYSLGASKDVDFSELDGDYSAINVPYYVSMALKSKPLDRSKGTITSIAYVMTLSFVLGIMFLIPPPLLTPLSSNARFAASCGLFFLLVLLAFVLREELNELPLRLWVETVYLLSAEGRCELGTHFEKVEDALNKNDWSSAELWVQRMYYEGRYFPRWPRRQESFEIMEFIVEEMILNRQIRKRMRRLPRGEERFKELTRKSGMPMTREEYEDRRKKKRT